jgi:2-hydroxy-6-oxonona-2,4-dienedioate hydrolase
MQSGFITLQNAEDIYYEEWGVEFKGKSPSLLFVHGNLSTCQWWHDPIDELQPTKRHIIAVDQRGFGQSSFKKACNRFVCWAEDLR